MVALNKARRPIQPVALIRTMSGRHYFKCSTGGCNLTANGFVYSFSTVLEDRCPCVN